MEKDTKIVEAVKIIAKVINLKKEKEKLLEQYKNDTTNTTYIFKDRELTKEIESLNNLLKKLGYNN